VNIKKLPPKATIGLIIGGDLLLLLVGWFLLIGPQRATASSIALATAATEAQLIEAQKPVVIPKPPAAVVQPVIQTADLYSLAKAMPSTVDQPTLLLELDQIARSAGVTVTSIGFTGPQQALGATFGTVGISMAISGDFYSITDMLYRLRSQVGVRNGTLQTSGRLFSVGSVGITPAGASGGAALSVTLAITAFVYGAPAAAAAALATPPPPSTDTTQTATTAAPSSDVAPAP
jgi:hypothetical protein